MAKHICLLVGCLTIAPFAQEKNAWSGVYTAAQAERGLKRYEENCGACHGVDLLGGPGVPGLAGAEFLFNYNNLTAADLFEFVKKNMPPGQQGSLNDQQYVDIVAAMFKANEFAPGEAELTPDPAVLKTIKITRSKP
jgi:S-disulfanyl-L-cysteine oxidoreductase SoxD